MIHKQHARLWHTAREYAGHWMVAGVILAATGAAPEHWFADTLQHLHLPIEGLHLWGAGIDLRLVLIGAGVLMIGGDVAWRRMRPHAASDAVSMLSSDALPLPDRPSIAVLPFANLSGDPEQEYFSDGVADDIITELSRDRALFVIARNSSFTYRGRSIDIKQAGRELGVRYVVEGSVRREADRVRVTAQLIDATTGSHIWAERYDRALEHVFDVQDEIAAAVANAIRPVLGDEEQRRVLRKPPGNLSAWEEYQRGLSALASATIASTARARRYFQRSSEIDPGFAPAFTGLAYTYIQDSVYHGVLAWDDAVALVEAAGRKAVALDPNDSEAHAALAHAYQFYDYGAARVEVDRALALNRNSVWGHTVKGAVLVWTGHCSEGRDEAGIALRLNPRGFIAPMTASLMPASYYFERDYAAAVEAARRSLADYPDYHPPRRFLVAGLAQLGRGEEAKAALNDLERLAPRVVDAMLRQRPPYHRPEDQAHLLDGLHKAGWRG